MKIDLLTHERELDRPTNTGTVVLAATSSGEGVVKRIVWSRVHPDQSLVETLACGSAGLVYPSPEVDPVSECQVIPLEQCENFILLDATWQEARKMYNRSPYLKTANRVVLDPVHASRYRLRRNQKADGLCTAECVVEILRGKGREQLASEVELAFDRFNAGLS
ncbi:DTW domain-containing protein [Microbulbifer elongatus]|uniref:tRNA-uridine aminocarboxypropyltransferase n=1 Tax=Microbulbifer elongatus TaxID=86173 RepID=A0ABT1P100_9GAMM|nr:DTW domain-containing protein [Microbulbifer elongatus]